MKNNDLEFIAQVLNDSLIEFNNKKLEPSVYFVVGLISRAEKILNSLIVLNQSQINENSEFTMGLIIRTLMTDKISFLYFLSFSSDKIDINILNDKACSILAGGISSLKTNVKKLGKSGVLSKELEEQLISGISNRYDPFFTYNDNDSKTGKQLDDLNQRPGFNELTSRVYDYYARYSKYEHFSQIYFEMMKIDLKNRIEDLEKSIVLIQIYCGLLVNVLKDMNSDSNLLKILSIKIEQFIKKNTVPNSKS